MKPYDIFRFALAGAVFYLFIGVVFAASTETNVGRSKGETATAVLAWPLLVLIVFLVFVIRLPSRIASLAREICGL